MIEDGLGKWSAKSNLLSSRTNLLNVKILDEEKGCKRNLGCLNPDI
jgi:hypothetical protein